MDTDQTAPNMEQSDLSYGGFHYTTTDNKKLHFSTLENHCTQTAQSSRDGCSQRVHKIVYLAVNKGNILVNILLLKIFIVNHVTYKSNCVSV